MPMVQTCRGVRVMTAAGLVVLASLCAPSASSLAPTAGVHPDQLALYTGPDFACKDGEQQDCDRPGQRQLLRLCRRQVRVRPPYLRRGAPFCHRACARRVA